MNALDQVIVATTRLATALRNPNHVGMTQAIRLAADAAEAMKSELRAMSASYGPGVSRERFIQVKPVLRSLEVEFRKACEIVSPGKLSPEPMFGSDEPTETDETPVDADYELERIGGSLEELARA